MLWDEVVDSSARGDRDISDRALLPEMSKVMLRRDTCTQQTMLQTNKLFQPFLNKPSTILRRQRCIFKAQIKSS